MNTEILLQENYKHVNIWNTDLYVNEEGTVYRLDKRNKKITLCSDNKPDNTTGYKRIILTNNQRKKKQFYINRLVYYAFNSNWNIFDSSTDNFIDHINRNPTDNRISNLRNVTQQHNNFNKNCKGYSYNKQTKKYHAYIRLNGKQKYLGYFENEEEARQAYLEAKPKYHVIIDL
jgi:hypothetical protein